MFIQIFAPECMHENHSLHLPREPTYLWGIKFLDGTTKKTISQKRAEEARASKVILTNLFFGGLFQFMQYNRNLYQNRLMKVHRILLR